MKKFALLLAVAALAASPAAAASKHKKQKPDDTFAKQSANTMRILRDGMPLVLPSWALPVYFGMGMDKTGKPEKKKHHGKKM